MSAAPHPERHRAQPRLALHFSRGRGRLLLARPLAFSLGTVERLELDLGRLTFPLDLRAGPAGFASRRTELIHLEARLPLSAILRVGVAEPDDVRPLASRRGATGRDWAIRDPFGTVACTATFAMQQGDLLCAIHGARTAVEGPAPPIRRALAALQALGFALDPDAGVLVLRRALFPVLAEALLPAGFRVPTNLALPARLTLEEEAFRLVAGQSEREPTLPAPFRGARRRATMLQAFDQGHMAIREAARAWVEAHPTPDPEDLAELATWDLAEIPPEADPVHPAGLAAALRRAVADRPSPSAVLSLAERLAAAEPSAAVAVEALLLAADALGPGEAARSLQARAAARRPREARLALRLVEAVVRADPDPPPATVRRWLEAREPGPERGTFARDAARICEVAGADGVALRLWRHARQDLPQDGAVLLGFGRAVARAGAEEEAQAAFDRAAAAFGAEGANEARAEAEWRAAEVADDDGEAGARLERLLTRAPDHRRALAKLASLRRAAGAEASARRLEDRLLAALERVSASGPAEPAVLEALRAAVLAATDPARADVFREALARRAARGSVPPPAPDGPPTIPAPPLTEPDSPLALAEAAAEAGDFARLRAAIEAAERGGDVSLVIAVLELALRAVGEGPAARHLRARLEALRGVS